MTLSAPKTVNYGKQVMAWKNCSTLHSISNRTMKRRETVTYTMMKTTSIMVDAICYESSSVAVLPKLYNVNLQFDPTISEARKPAKLVLTVAE
jgi:hypothetical protein